MIAKARILRNFWRSLSFEAVFSAFMRYKQMSGSFFLLGRYNHIVWRRCHCKAVLPHRVSRSLAKPATPQASESALAWIVQESVRDAVLDSQGGVGMLCA